MSQDSPDQPVTDTAGVAAGWCTPAHADVIRAVAGQARADMIEPWTWPLDEGWEGWRPPDAWDEPLRLPASLALPS